MKPYQEQMLLDLRALGVREDDTLLMHSSFKSLGWEKGATPTEALEVLKLAVAKGTLMLPALSYDLVGKENPFFSVNDTPCCIGILPETFRKMDGVYRSACATHSVSVWGKDAKQIAEAQLADDTPVGPHSPFAEVRRRGGKILMLGCGLEPCTTMHGVEELSQPDYLFDGDVVYTVTLADGSKTTHRLKRHGFAHTIQRYDRIEQILSPDELKCGKVCGATAWLIDAASLWKKADEVLRKDPHAFVDFV